MACEKRMNPGAFRAVLMPGQGRLAGYAIGSLLLGGLLLGTTALAEGTGPATATTPAMGHAVSSAAGKVPAAGQAGKRDGQEPSPLPAGGAASSTGAGMVRDDRAGAGSQDTGPESTGPQAGPRPAGQPRPSAPVPVSSPARSSGPAGPAAGSAAGSGTHDSNGHGPNAAPGGAGVASSGNGVSSASAVDAANRPGPDKPASKPALSRKKPESSRKNANNLLIPLPADESVGRQDVDYTCSIDEKKAGDEVRSLRTSLPAGRFTVTYLSADIMALAVLPVDGRVMVFANVVAGDGAKYVGDRYGWWARGDEVTFSRQDRDGVSFSCHVVPAAPPPSPSPSPTAPPPPASSGR